MSEQTVTRSTPAPDVWPTEPPGYEARPAAGVSLVELANVALRRWRFLIGLPVVAALVAAAASLFIPPTFTATAVFTPEAGAQSRVPSALAGVAGQLGLALGPEPGQSPRFYGEVLTSRELVQRVLLARYPDPRTDRALTDSASLLDILGIRAKDSLTRVFLSVNELRRVVVVQVDNPTNIIRVNVSSRYPSLAAAVANRFVENLNEFNTNRRKLQARQRRLFVEVRLAEVEADLRRTEDEVKGFYARNLSWQESPQLGFEEGRLRRQVQIHQEVYLTLRREYETARIAEVNETPLITPIDPATSPRERSSPNRRLLVTLALFVGGLLGVFAAFSAEYWEGLRRENGGEYRELKRRLDGVLGRIRRRGRHRIGE